MEWLGTDYLSYYVAGRLKGLTNMVQSQSSLMSVDESLQNYLSLSGSTDVDPTPTDGYRGVFLSALFFLI